METVSDNSLIWSAHESVSSIISCGSCLWFLFPLWFVLVYELLIFLRLLIVKSLWDLGDMCVLPERIYIYLYESRLSKLYTQFVDFQTTKTMWNWAVNLRKPVCGSEILITTFNQHPLVSRFKWVSFLLVFSSVDYFWPTLSLNIKPFRISVVRR